MPGETLRLFLLHSVLFPGQTMQLVVFEPRYHQLVRECLESGEAFGIALIREGPEVGAGAAPYSVGTTARIKRATPLPDGRTALEVVGERRFRILEMHHDRPYAWADIEYAGEGTGAAPLGIALEQTREAYRELVRVRQAGAGEYEREIKVPEDPSALADAVGALQLGSAGQRQRILEADEPATRLERAWELLQRSATGVRRQSARAIADRMRGPRLN